MRNFVPEAMYLHSLRRQLAIFNSQNRLFNLPSLAPLIMIASPCSGLSGKRSPSLSLLSRKPHYPRFSPTRPRPRDMYIRRYHWAAAELSCVSLVKKLLFCLCRKSSWARTFRLLLLEVADQRSLGLDRDGWVMRMNVGRFSFELFDRLVGVLWKERQVSTRSYL